MQAGHDEEDDITHRVDQRTDYLIEYSAADSPRTASDTQHAGYILDWEGFGDDDDNRVQPALAHGSD